MIKKITVLLILFTISNCSLERHQAQNKKNYKVIMGGGFDNPSVWQYCIDEVVYLGYTYNNTAGSLLPKLLSSGKVATCISH